MRLFYQLVCVLPLWFGQAFADDYSSLSVVNPFGTEAKKNAFYEEYHTKFNISEDFLSNSGNILEFGYRFELTACAVSKTCARDEDAAVVYRESLLDQSRVEQDVRVAIQSMRKDGCSYVNFSDPTRVATFDDQVIYKSEISGKVRACLGLLGTHDIGSIEGSVLATISLQRFDVSVNGSEPPLRLTSSSSIDQSTKLFGLIDVNSDLGKALAFLGAYAVSGPFLSMVLAPELNLPDPKSDVATNMIARFTDEVARTGMTYNQFTKEIEKLLLIMQQYRSDPVRTGFRDVDGKLIVKIVNKAVVPWAQLESYYSWKVDEIEALRTLGDPDRQYVVQKGDTLWSIAKNNYRYGEFYQMIADWNRIDQNKLVVGQTLVLRPFYKAVGSKENLVVPGDSLWKLWKANSRGLTWKDFRKFAKPLRARSDAMIYPLQELGGAY
jgi:hypothetical protein